MMPERQRCLDAMQAAADAAAEVSLSLFRSPHRVDNKDSDGGFDPVTAADRGAEAAIRRVLAERMPGPGFIGEEQGSDIGSAREVWVVDPIDGTRAFIAGVPLWSTLIGLSGLDAMGAFETVHYGLWDQPFTGERMFGAEDETLYLRHGAAPRAVKTRASATLDQTILMTTDPGLFAETEEADAFARLQSQVRLCRYGADAYAYALLAMGHVDLVVESGLKPFDIHALVPIIQGAGGVISNWHGGAVLDGGQVVAAANAELHEAALNLLRSR